MIKGWQSEKEILDYINMGENIFIVYAVKLNNEIIILFKKENFIMLHNNVFTHYANMQNHQEIERKFLVSKVPEKFTKEYKIEQHYLEVGESEIRLRKQESAEKNQYFITYKTGKNPVRIEIEEKISEKLYLALLDSRIPLEKHRKIIVEDDNTVEVDFYANKELGDLIVAEVEFATIEQARVFAPPAWFGKEVTSEPNYKNQKLWSLLQRKRELA